MICTNCGTNVEEGLSFCPSCGSPVSAPQPAPQPQVTYEQPAPQPQANYQQAAPQSQPAYQQAQPNYQQAGYQQTGYQQTGYQQTQPNYQANGVVAPVEPSSVLTMGIVGLAVAEFGIPGIIVSAIARNKAKTYNESGAPYSTKVKVGNGLALGGLIYGIVMTAIIVFYILFIIIAAVANVAMYY